MTSSNDGSCPICLTLGHARRECPALRPCTHCGMRGHPEQACSSRAEVQQHRLRVQEEARQENEQMEQARLRLQEAILAGEDPVRRHTDPEDFVPEDFVPEDFVPEDSDPQDPAGL